MSLNAYLTPSYAMVDNPIRLDIISTSAVNYTVKVGDDVFEASAESGFFNVFIGDVVKSYLSATRFTGEETDIVLSCPNNMKEVTVAVTNTEGDPEITKTIIALYGGISKRAFRSLKNSGTNIFTYKLLNDAGNFFMTTRSEGKFVKIRETELLPILFVAPVVAFTVTDGTNSYAVSGLTVGSCYALNLDAIRKKFFIENNILSNVFSVKVGDAISMTFIIINAQTEKNRYYLDFLNSYGSYERMEICGKPSLENETSDSSSGFELYDEDIDDYVSSRDRVESTEKLTVTTGFKGESEFRFILDMLASDAIYLKGYESREIKINATAESLALAKNIEQPQEVSLMLAFADSEHNHTETLSDEDYGNPRIFTDVFVKQFN
jgi:hypothetical protein